MKMDLLKLEVQNLSDAKQANETEISEFKEKVSGLEERGSKLENEKQNIRNKFKRWSKKKQT